MNIVLCTRMIESVMDSGKGCIYDNEKPGNIDGDVRTMLKEIESKYK